MGKQINDFLKNGHWKRVLSFCMALALILALVPAAPLTAHAVTAGDTLYMKPCGDWLWDSPWFAAYFFNGTSDVTWAKMTDSDGDGYYEATIPSGGYKSVIFCRMNPSNTALSWDSKWNQTGDLTIPTDGKNCFTLDAGWNGTGSWSTYTPAGSETTEPTDPATPAEPVENVTIHYRNTGLWETVCGYAWTEGETDDQDVAISAWPGSVLTEEAEHKNWYTLTLTELNAANGVGVIFNNNNGSQTDNVSITASGEYWYDGALSTTAPDTWADGTVETVTYEVSLHFANTLNWGSVNLYTWTSIGSNPTGSWPGSAAGLDSDGFYSVNFTYEAPADQGLNFIFSGGGQTADLVLSADAFTGNDEDGYYAEKWVVPTTAYDDYGTTKYYADIVDDPEAIAISPVVNGTSVTFEYKSSTATSVEVFGSMNSWASGYAMTKNSYGVWSVTLSDVACGIHQYKLVVDGNWIIDPLNSWVITESNGNQNSAFLISDPTSDTNTITIKVHYNAPSTEWNVCAWGAPNLEKQYDFTDGVATITLNGRESQYVAFKVRKSIAGNDWAEQSGEIRIGLSNIVSGTIDVYVGSNFSVSQSLNADVVNTNKVNSVELDYDTGGITVVTSKTVTSENTLDAFQLINTETGKTVELEYITNTGSTYVLMPAEEIALVDLYKYKVIFTEQAMFKDYQYTIGINTVYASDKFGAEYTYTGTDLGVTLEENLTIFRLWAPTAQKVLVNLYTSGTAGTNDLIKSVEMSKDINGTWIAVEEENLSGTYYTYCVTRDGETVEAVDPYARTTGVNGKRGMIIDLDSTDPIDWEVDTDPNPLTSYTDAIIYELHVRDFSIDDSSGVKDEWQGKFLALTQTGTTTENGTVTGLDHLKDLGITHLHLLPVYDYGSVDESKLDVPQFNWGYDPMNYNVPEGSYSTNPYNGEVRVSEFKQMVSALHDAGISVIMDVVYNHVYDAGVFSMNQIVPGYFSRTNADGSYSNGSGCGNDTASEREMVRKYIVDSVNYWADEYHVDGFRFDLVGLLDATTINEIVDTVHENHPGAIFYGEGWTLGTAVEAGNTMATQANSSATPEFAYFSDTIRNLLAGSNGTSVGFVSGLTGQEEAVANNFMARPWWTSNPSQIIQYASCHDNYTLIDKLILSTGKSGIDAQIIKMNNLAAAIYLTSQGIPFIHAGEEFLREKLEEDGSRCENSYNASDYVNHIEWSNLDDATYAANSAYYKGLIEFRKAHAALRLSTTELVTENVKYTWITNEVVMFTINGGINGEIADQIVVIFNANSSTKNVSLPEGTWSVCIDGTKAGVEELYTASGSVSVAGISAMVLVRGQLSCDHSYDAVVTEPTCTEGGYTTYTCSKCGDTYTGDETAALGHSWTDGVCGTCGQVCEHTYENGNCTTCGAAEPVSGTSVYVRVSRLWKSANARFAIYYFNDTTGTNGWVDLTDTDGDGFYEADIPGGYTTIIIIRQNPATTENSWDNSWGQTGNLTLTEGKNYYYMPENEWDQADLNDNYWSTESEPIDYTFYLRGNFNDWGTDTVMTDNGDGTYTATITLEAGSYEYKVATEDWTRGIDSNVALELTAKSEVTVTMTEDNGSYTASHTIKEVTPAAATITPQSATLSLEDEVLYNIYFTINNLNVDTADMGLLMWNSDPGTADYATAEKITTGVTYDNDQDRYQATSAGIPAKEMGDQKYLCVYAKLADGSYVYSRVFTYSAKRYVTNCLNGDSSDSLKKLCVALMNYGAAAQVYFNYNTDNLMNSDLANAPEIEGYSADLLGDVVAADSGKAGAFAATTSGYTKKNATATLEGAFAINFYFTTSQEASDLTMYYWTADVYNAAETLTAENASGKVTMTTTETENRYAGTISGIAAKEMEDTYYVCGVYTVDGETYSTGIVAYSMAKYFKNAAEKATGNTVTLAQAAVVYGYYAKAHFG